MTDIKQNLKRLQVTAQLYVQALWAMGQGVPQQVLDDANNRNCPRDYTAQLLELLAREK
jgi:hypothetical protein